MGVENDFNTGWFENFLAGRGISAFCLTAFSFSGQRLLRRSDLVGGLRKVEF